MSDLSEQKPIIKIKDQIGLIGVLLAAFSAPFTMAFNIGAVADHFVNSSRGEIGTMATLELFSISLVSIIVSRNTHLVKSRLPFLVGGLIVVIGHLLTIYAQDLNMIFLARVVSGLGSGAIVASVMVIIVRGQNALMTFALLNSGVGVAGVLLSLIVPRIISIYGMEGAYFVHLIFSLFIFAFIPLISSLGNKKEEQLQFSPYTGKAGWIAMFGVAFAFFAHGGLLTFAERIGAGLSISTITMGNAFAVGGILTIIGPLIAGFIGSRYGSMRPSVFFLTLMIFVAFFVANAWNPMIFFIAIPIFGLLPIMWTPFFLGGIANLDSSGRLAAAHPAFVTMGGAIGPMLMGYVSDYGGFSAIGWVAMFFILISIPMVIIGTNAADQKN